MENLRTKECRKLQTALILRGDQNLGLLGGETPSVVLSNLTTITVLRLARER